MSVFIHRGGFKEYIKKCPITSLFILANTVMYIISVVLPGDFIDNLVKLGGLVPFIVRLTNEYYRLFTTIFLHGSFLHYAMNTFFGLLIISAALERLIGSFRYFFIYIISGLASSVFIYLYYIDRDPITLTIGASGAIYGVMGCFLYIIFLKGYLLNNFEQRYIRNLLLINIVFTFLVPGISKIGHLGGLIGGLLVSPLFLYKK